MKAKIDGSGNLDLIPECEAEEALLRIWRERQQRIASTGYTTRAGERQALDRVTIEFCEIKKSGAMTDRDIAQAARRVYGIPEIDPRIEHYRRGIRSVVGSFGEVVKIEKWIGLWYTPIWMGYSEKYNVICIADIGEEMIDS